MELIGNKVYRVNMQYLEDLLIQLDLIYNEHNLDYQFGDVMQEYNDFIVVYIVQLVKQTKNGKEVQAIFQLLLEYQILQYSYDCFYYLDIVNKSLNRFLECRDKENNIIRYNLEHCLLQNKSIIQYLLNQGFHIMNNNRNTMDVDRHCGHK